MGVRNGITPRGGSHAGRVRFEMRNLQICDKSKNPLGVFRVSKKIRKGAPQTDGASQID